MPLGDYVEGRFYRGILTGLNAAFIVDRAARDRLIDQHPSSADVLRPFLRGRDVKRWRVEFDEQYLIKIESSANVSHPWSNKPDEEAEEIFARTYPAIYQHFQPYRDRLIKRYDQGQYYWELRSCSYWHEFEEPKIIYQEIATHQAFAWEDSLMISNNKTFLLPDVDLFLLGLLNSAVVWFFLDKVVSKLQNNAFAMQMPYVSQTPIPDGPEIKEVERVVRQILAAEDKEQTANVSVLEAQINQLAYDLYKLTPAEIAIVEGRDPGEIEALLADEESTGDDLPAYGASAPPLIFTGQPPQGNLNQRMKRVRELAQKPTPAAIQQLTAALDDPQYTIRYLAAATLRRLATPQVVGVLKAYVEQAGDGPGKEEAQKVLERLGDGKS